MFSGLDLDLNGGFTIIKLVDSILFPAELQSFLEKYASNTSLKDRFVAITYDQ